MYDVIYITNKEVPYKVSFFNLLAQKCNLKVIFETKNQDERNVKWSKSIENKFKYSYLFEKNKNRLFSFKLLNELIKNRKRIIVFGCSNSKIQLNAMLLCRLFHIRFIINIDGEYFFKSNSIKCKLKKFLIRGAEHYIVAGEKATSNFKKCMNTSNVSCYHFSSLSNNDIEENAKNANVKQDNSKILFVGRADDHKGLDVLLNVAEMNLCFQYKIIGVDKDYDRVCSIVKERKLTNIEIVPFLQKKDLCKEYQNCEMFVLPSRMECWGLVINEAASFGCPIVSTRGSGAAVEFLNAPYDEFLAEINNSDDLYNKIKTLHEYNRINEYRKYLIQKSQQYSIENIVNEHIEIFEKIHI